MYERLLNKQNNPTMEDLILHCGDSGELFVQLNDFLSGIYETTQEIVFPYGNKYGWGIAHRKNKKLVCNIFAEQDAFTVMMRLSGKQYDSVYEQLQEYTRNYIDHKYPCGDGGWIHYRVTDREHLEDIKKLLTVKCK